MKKLFYAVILAVFVSGIAFASFPVRTADQIEKTATAEGTEMVVEQATEAAAAIEATEPAEANGLEGMFDAGLDEMVILLLLWFFLGGLAAHRWYAKKPVGWNILFILTAGGCMIWALVDLIKIVTGEF